MKAKPSRLASTKLSIIKQSLAFVPTLFVLQIVVLQRLSEMKQEITEATEKSDFQPPLPLFSSVKKTESDYGI